MTTRVLPEQTTSRIAGCLQDLALAAARSREELMDEKPLHVWYGVVAPAIQELYQLLGGLDPDQML